MSEMTHDRDEALALLRAGASIEEAAGKVGRSPETVSVWLAERAPAARLAHIAVLARDLPPPQGAAELREHITVVRLLLARAGLRAGLMIWVDDPDLLQAADCVRPPRLNGSGREIEIVQSGRDKEFPQTRDGVDLKLVHHRAATREDIMAMWPSSDEGQS